MADKKTERGHKSQKEKIDSGTTKWYYKGVNKKHRQTLAAIFAKPDRKNITWDSFISLLEALGAQIRYRGGSMVGVQLNDCYAVFHRPHPGNEIYHSDLKRIRKFMKNAGIEFAGGRDAEV